MQQFVILSIDGGGIRGVFAARLLELLRASSKLPAFNLIAGTSTGSIIASCMALKIDPSIIVSLYQASGSIIFSKKFFFGPRLLEKAVQSSYDNGRLKAVLRQVFGKKRLHDVKLPLLIPTTDLKAGSGHLFSSFANDNPYLYEAILASCSAPTYFDPTVVDGKLLADGGMWGNNPILSAIAIARDHFKVPFDKIKVISLGSGHFSGFYDDENKRWGLINGWKIRTLTEFLASLQSEATNQISKKLLNQNQLLRLNFKSDNLISPDEFDKTDELIQFADELYITEKIRIDNFLNPL